MTSRVLRRLVGALALSAVGCAAPEPAPPRRLVAIFVIDGLRPDSITPADTPTLARYRDAGVEFTNSHSVFPTVTRVNAATLATGADPARHGIVGRSRSGTCGLWGSQI
jgi:predicted AlkP superfamily pyrophosphatase or phosphodiesterase